MELHDDDGVQIGSRYNLFAFGITAVAVQALVTGEWLVTWVKSDDTIGRFRSLEAEPRAETDWVPLL